MNMDFQVRYFLNVDAELIEREPDHQSSLHSEINRTMIIGLVYNRTS